MIYTELFGKYKGTHDRDEEKHDIDSHIEDDDIEGIDGFAGDININNVSRVEAV